MYYIHMHISILHQLSIYHPDPTVLSLVPRSRADRIIPPNYFQTIMVFLVTLAPHLSKEALPFI